MPETKSTCCYCGVGCGVVIGHEGGAIRSVRGDPEHPANFGRLCTKGHALAKSAAPTLLGARLLHPEIDGRRASWDETLDHVAARFAKTIAEHGPDSVAFYISGQLLTEDYYVFNKLAKGLVGTNNVDTNSRLCMSSAVAGYKQTLGADAPPACYEDIDHASCLFIAGSNTAWAHPVLYRRIEDARARNPSLKTIVVDPRRTDTARQATLHLQIQPGTDVALFNGLLHVMLWEDLIDRRYVDAHTVGFDTVRETVREFTPKATATTCGIPEAQVVEAARLFARSAATLSLYCQGLNQSASGTAKNAALVNLHLATGQIGRPGAGPFSLTGQPNAMGGREVGGMANLLSAHRDLANPAHREEVARLWGVDAVPAKPGKTAVELFEALRRGEVKAVWIACTNPAQSMPDLNLVHEALSKAELVVVQEAYLHTETTRFAHVLLPASTWGEKEGTVTNSERRISRVRAAIPAPGEARHDWAIATEFARRLEQCLRPGRPTLFPYATPESVFDEHRETTRGRDLDITGISYTRLEAQGPLQWPCPDGAAEGRRRLYEDGVFPTPDGRARFVATPWRDVAEKANAQYPLRLTTGRLRDQWHAMSRTGTVATLFSHAPEPRLAMHRADLERYGLQDGALVRVASRRGELHVIVEESDTVKSGVAFLPMHWGERFLAGERSRGVNGLTSPATDPHSRQPELKHCAVRVERAALPWRLVAFGRATDATLDVLSERLSPAMAQFAFASRTLTGADGVLLRLAAKDAPGAAALEAIDAAFGVDEAGALRYDDPTRGIGRRIALDGSALRAVRLSGDVRSERWLHDYWARGATIDAVRRFLAMPVGAPPGVVAQSSRTICACHGVSESRIRAAIANGAASVPALKLQLRCGTTCGSCVPELQALVQHARAAA